MLSGKYNCIQRKLTFHEALVGVEGGEPPPAQSGRSEPAIRRSIGERFPALHLAPEQSQSFTFMILDVDNRSRAGKLGVMFSKTPPTF